MKRFELRIDNDEVVTYLDRKAEELSFNTGKPISRNKLINLILEHEVKKDLSMVREVDVLKDSLDDFRSLLQKYIESNEAILYQATRQYE